MKLRDLNLLLRPTQYVLVRSPAGYYYWVDLDPATRDIDAPPGSVFVYHFSRVPPAEWVALAKAQRDLQTVLSLTTNKNI